jgi:hypothetical protein
VTEGHVEQFLSDLVANIDRTGERRIADIVVMPFSASSVAT